MYQSKTKQIKTKNTSKNNSKTPNNHTKGKNDTDLIEFIESEQQKQYQTEGNDKALQEENKEEQDQYKILEDIQEQEDSQRQPLSGFQQFLQKKYASTQNPKSQTQNNQAQNQQDPSESDLEKQQKENELEEQQLQKQKNISNVLANYNLLLLRKIFDAYDQKGDKVLRSFRNDKNHILRKRYMNAIVNPNYDYDKLMKDMEIQEEVIENVDENSVLLEKNEKMQGESKFQTESENVEKKHSPEDDQQVYKREWIDRFGRKIQDVLDQNDIEVQLPMPEKGEIQMECEEVGEEEDDWSQKMKELQQLRDKKKREGLTDEEEKRLSQLEQEEDIHRHQIIEQLQQKGKKRSKGEEKIMKQLLEDEDEYRERRITELIKQQKTTGLNEEEENYLQTLIEWQNDKKRKLLQDLRRKLKNKTITDEELEILRQLEEWEWQQKQKELERLREKIRNGEDLTDEEKQRLKELEEEEILRQKKELDELRKKLKNGTITEEEMKKLLELEELEKKRRLKELELQEDKRLNKIDEDIRKLLEKGEENLNDRERLKLLELQREKVSIQCEKIKRKEQDMTNEDIKQVNQYEDEIDKLDYEILLLKQKLGLLTHEEELRLKELEQKLQMNNQSHIENQEELHDDEVQNDINMLEENNITVPEVNPFEEQDQLNEKQKVYLEEQQKAQEDQDQASQEGEDQENQSEMAESKITDKDMFVDLPPIEVLNNQSRPQTQQKSNRSIKNNEIQENDINKQQKQDDEMFNNSQITSKSIQNKQLNKSQQRINSAKSSTKLQNQSQLDQIKQNKDKQGSPIKKQHLNEEEEDNKQMQNSKQKMDIENNNQDIESQQNSIDKHNELESQRSSKQQKIKQENEQNQHKSRPETPQVNKSQQKIDNQSPHNKVGSPEHDNQEEIDLENQTNKDGSPIANKGGIPINEKNSRPQTPIDHKNQQNQQHQQTPFDENESKNQEIQNKQQQDLRQQIASSKSTRTVKFNEQQLEQDQQQKNITPKQKSQLNQSQKEDNSQEHSFDNKQPDEMLEFGQEDIDENNNMQRQESNKNTVQNMNEQEESIYSHKTSAILDEEKVSFMHIDNLPNQDNASEDSFSEQDMVYYNKDDLTNYSKGRNLNRVKPKEIYPQSDQKKRANSKKKQQPQYYSENDIQEDQEEQKNELNESEESVYTIDENGQRVRKQGRGRIRHNDLEMESYDDNIDGRVKVDSWNLNYNGKKKKQKKRKLDQKTKNRMNDLQQIYGVDAKTLAGLQKGSLPKGKGKDGDSTLGGPSRFNNTDNSFRSTQNTFQKQQLTRGLEQRQTPGNQQQMRSIDNQSNMFSFNGGKSVFSKRWNDIESTLKGGKLNNNQRFPKSQMKKMTSTQNQFNQPGQLEEESKSGGSFSRGNNGLSSVKKGNKQKDRDYETYSESDEGVNDQNTIFQGQDTELQQEILGKQRKNIKKSSKKKQIQKRQNDGGMNDDLDHHSESDEGVNEGNNPHFDDNDNLFFKKRDKGESGIKSKLSKDNTHKKSNNFNMNDEDLEAQEIGGSRLKAKQQSKVKQHKNSDEEGNIFGMQQNTNFNKFQQQNENNNDDIEPFGVSKSKQNSGQKPPLGVKNRKVNNNVQQFQDDQSQHSREQSQNRMRRIGGGYTDISDYEMNQNKHKQRVSNQDNNGIKSSQIQMRNRSNDDQYEDEDSYIIGPESNHSMIRTRDGFGNGIGNGIGNQMDEKYYNIQRDTQFDHEYEQNQNDQQLAKKRKVKRVVANSTSTGLDHRGNKAEQQRIERLKRKQIEEEKVIISQHKRTGQSLDTSINAKLKKKKQKKDWVKKEVNYWLDYDSPYAEYLVARFREWSPNVQELQPKGQNQNRNQIQVQKINQVQNAYGKQHNDQDSRSNQSLSRGALSSRSPPQKIIKQQRNERNERNDSDIERIRKVSDGNLPWKQQNQQQINNLFAEDIDD